MSARNYLLTGGMLLAVALAPGGSATASQGPGPTAAQGSVVPSAAVDCRSRSDCAATFVGGLQLQSTGWACTSGFVARSTTTQQLYVVTAGHCIADSGLFALWSHHGKTVGRATITAFRPDSAADVAAIEIPVGSVGNGVYSSAPMAIRLVTGRAPDAAQAVGSAVCRSGGVSGWRCGSITRADVATSIRNIPLRHTWWLDFPSTKGDSGSPVLDAEGRIAGIVIATTATESVYSTVDAIAEELGVRPCLDYACD
jgi:streptogrisin B